MTGSMHLRIALAALGALLLAGGALPGSATPSARVRVTEESLTVRAYDWRAGLVPTAPDDPVYPYPRMDFARVGPADTALQVVVLESAGTRVVVAPALGGQILRWTDKRLGREVLYANPVIKPSPWGARGWWLATGGMQWAFPTAEHGLNEWRLWRYRTFSGSNYAGVTLWDHEDRSGLDVSVTVVLYASERISVRPRIANHTRASQPYQFWINAMLPYDPALVLEFPATQVTVHSTGDENLPLPGQAMSWPVYAGRDFSRAGEWRAYLGVFAAPATAGRAAVLDPRDGTRVVRTFPLWAAPGVKLFLLGDIAADTYTDGDSRYLELWGGRTRDFDSLALLRPGYSVTWVEYWAMEGVGQ